MSQNNESKGSGVGRRANYQWQFIGEAGVLRRQRCQHLFAEKHKRFDLVLLCHKEKFHAMEAWCSHLGGPLFQGDIEDYNGSPHVMCPWHAYMFDIKTGQNDIGLQQEIYDVKEEEGKLYILYHCALTLKPSTT